MTDTATKCHYCQQGEAELGPGALRPYGPGGTAVCFPCVSDEAHPEREQAAHDAFTAQINATMAASPIGGAIVDPDGNLIPATVETLEALGVPVIEVHECDHPECQGNGQMEVVEALTTCGHPECEAAAQAVVRFPDDPTLN